jgi:hypothetical protein
VPFVVAAATGVTTGSVAPKNSVTLLLPEFATHTLPELSIAMAEGAFKPPPDNPCVGEMAPPVLAKVESVLLPFAIQTTPAPLIASEVGALRPPPVKMPSREPVLLNSTRLLAENDDVQALPELSIAMPEVPPFSGAMAGMPPLLRTLIVLSVLTTGKSASVLLCQRSG